MVEKGDVLNVPKEVTRHKVRIEWSPGVFKSKRSEEYNMLVAENTTRKERRGYVIVFIHVDRDDGRTDYNFTVDDSWQWGRGGDDGDRFLVLHGKDREIWSWRFCRAVLDIAEDYRLEDYWLSRAQGNVVDWSGWQDSTMNMSHMTPVQGARQHYGGSLVGNDYLHNF
ncbi:hypothetical protein NKR23_g3749 [Pleurostoma richardsiae]|uniref:Uncharacterized protein n=1 Tax=Pleurostoma richardsiae TaxID=41990 RepID=A0AA38VGR4_9PEZI|nr:hypothetical protein NKR23_g3749 [Pleurostoma richardsiae]